MPSTFISSYSHVWLTLWFVLKPTVSVILPPSDLFSRDVTTFGDFWELPGECDAATALSLDDEEP